MASSSPLTERLDDMKRLEEAGAAAIVLPSLFEEQLELESLDLDRYLSHGEESHAEALSYLPDHGDFALGPNAYLDRVTEAKRVLGIPVIASLNGASTGGWTRYARRMEAAGADALELNVYYLPTDPDQAGSDVEDRYVDLVREVAGSVKIPVAVKLSTFLSAPVNLARRLGKAGAKGLVLFNRLYQPDFDLEKLDVVPSLELSTPSTLRIRLRWTAIIWGHTSADLAVSGGVHSGSDVLKCMMAGAKVAMVASSVLRHGAGHLRVMLDDLTHWMEEHDYASIRLMQGSMSQRACADPAAFERTNYMRVLRSYAIRGR
jgi:dihydroorotate dehydrogenase (fumarate)